MAFNSIDKDKSGYLSSDEIRTLLHECGYNRYTQDEIDKWIETVDKNGDGKISFDEFVIFLNNKIDDHIVAYNWYYEYIIVKIIGYVITVIQSIISKY